jgi:3-oxoacyl-ACP reductase-like protein
MSIFSSIKNAIFGRKAEAATPAPIAVADAAPAAPAPSLVVADIDVAANLAAMAEGKNLNWRTSIVDLMKLLGIDSSLSNRKELAMELGYTGSLDGSAEMNIWLHKATMRELAANGGKVPAELLD